MCIRNSIAQTWPAAQGLFGGSRAIAAARFLLAASLCHAGNNEPSRTHRLRLDRGGQIEGIVLDHDDKRVLLDMQGRLTIVGWWELTPPSACALRRSLLIAKRGGEEALTARDHLNLGIYALQRGVVPAARSAFDKAVEIDPALTPAVEQQLAEQRLRRSSSQASSAASTGEPHDSDARPATDSLVHVAAQRLIEPAPQSTPTERVEALRRFGDQLTDALDIRTTRLETDHFLIWTDWPKVNQQQLADLCETMYACCARQFGLPIEENIFDGKCPVFCLDTRAKYLRFARAVDRFESPTSIAYTRTTTTGHVHVVAGRYGRTPEEMDHFASTLVHEGVHVFMHRYRSNRPLPPWISEGLANWIAARALGDRCSFDGDAEMVARWHLRLDRSLKPLFDEQNKSLTSDLYPLAQSVVGFLIDRDEAAFVALIEDLKEGTSLSDALDRRYRETLDSLEQAWRRRFAP